RAAVVSRASGEWLHGRVSDGATRRAKRHLSVGAEVSSRRRLRDLDRAAAPAAPERARLPRALPRLSRATPRPGGAAARGHVAAHALAAVGPSLGRVLRARSHPALLLEPSRRRRPDGRPARRCRRDPGSGTRDLPAAGRGARRARARGRARRDHVRRLRSRLRTRAEALRVREPVARGPRLPLRASELALATSARP